MHLNAAYFTLKKQSKSKQYIIFPIHNFAQETLSHEIVMNNNETATNSNKIVSIMKKQPYKYRDLFNNMICFPSKTQHHTKSLAS